jgi:hypothetical protein
VSFCFLVEIVPMKPPVGRLVALLALVLLVSAGLGSVSAVAADNSEPKVIMDVSKAKYIVYSPAPQYPKVARINHLGGFGIYEVQFRRGVASAVFVTMSTGHKVLDDAAVVALRQWRSWKDVSRVMMVPITFASSSGTEPANNRQ